MLWGGRWEGGSCLGTHVRIKDFKIKKKKTKKIKIKKKKNEKTQMLGRIEGRRTTEDEIVGWHHRLNGHEFE